MKEPDIRYAVFDVGQTIYPFTLEPLNTLLKQKTADIAMFNNGHSAFRYDYNPYMKGQMSDEEFARELCFFCRVPYKDSLLPEISHTLHQGVGPHFAETTKAIELLKKQNTEICLLSNALPLLADTGANITAPQYAFTSFELGLLKPDPAIYQAVQQRLNCSFSQILFIDDKAENVVAAQKLGINGIIYRCETFLSEIRQFLKTSQPLRPKPCRSPKG